jgi:hypothetical protein
MIFTHDTELTLRAACVLINTDRVDGEQLGDLDTLDVYLDGFGWTGRRDNDTAELGSVHRLRERLGKIWAVADDEEQAVGQVNALLSDTRAMPWLTRHPEMPEWHLHLASRRTATRCWSTFRATGRGCSATPATAATASTWRRTGNGGRARRWPTSSRIRLDRVP